MATAHRVELADLVADLSEIVGRIVWSVVSTTDRLGRPRSRVMHPVWDFKALDGWIGTRRTPVKVAHLAAQSALTCAYWSPDHDAAFLDCTAEWAQDRDAAWAALAQGYNPATLWPDGPSSPDFAALRLRPYRIQVIKAASLATGAPTPMWAASEV
jgi:general stress protein 26